MITVRRSADRGRAYHGWLDSRHTFSFGDYHDPMHMGFRALRVLNEDRVEPGKGFAAHSHRDMEIISYVLEGALEHRDSMGTGSVIVPGDVQLMRAGHGVTHSEYNHSRQEPVHFLQIWIVPDTAGLTPAYEQLHFEAEVLRNALVCVASNAPGEGSLHVHQDVSMHAAILDPASSVRREIAPGRHAWIQIARGQATVRGAAEGSDVGLGEGDGAAVSGESLVEIVAGNSCELLLFDLA
ncbi:MAG TPA: pirin family protein [Candidatus Limnocylindrales bacterium]|nr:pirin family protein [Candidatus Limnocylindrales bacterium]